jgi:hypothetical protein
MKKTLARNWHLLLLLAGSLCMAWIVQRDTARFNDPSGLWSDRAGYYVYLPATFFCHFDSRRMPDSIDVKTGGGFSIDTLTNKLDVKYTYGVALLQSPFFAASWLWGKIAGIDDEQGFSMTYLWFLRLSSIFYVMAGCWFLKRFLDHYFPPPVTPLVILFLFLGTGLFYYTVMDGLMSHSYSFFLFALFLFSLKRFLDDGAFRCFLVLSISLALAILIRPTSIMLLSLPFLWDVRRPGEIFQRAGKLLQLRYLTVFAVILFLLFFPQMVYWKYLTGSWIHYSYGSEGFSLWRHPRIAEVLFSPLNGLFTHTPMVLFSLAGMVYMVILKKQNGWLLLAVFFAVTYLSASWKMWYFGCSYGQRSYIEYMALFAVPLGWIFAQLLRMRRMLPAGLLFFLLFLTTWFNLRYAFSLYRFERCYYGSVWDWPHYRFWLGKAGVLWPVPPPDSFVNDFENLAIFPGIKPSEIFTRSGQYSVAANQHETTLFTVDLIKRGNPIPNRAAVTFWMLKPGSQPTGATLVFAFSRDTTVIFSSHFPLDPVVLRPMAWTLVRKTFIIPDLNNPAQRIRIYISHPVRSVFFMDDLEVKYLNNWNENQVACYR